MILSETILFAESEASSDSIAYGMLEQKGFGVMRARTRSDFFSKVNDSIDVAVIDISLDSEGGTAYLDFMQENFPHTPVILVSGKAHSSVDFKSDLLQTGVFSYLEGPLDTEKFLQEVLNALTYRKELVFAGREYGGLKISPPPIAILGSSPSSAEVLDRIKKLALSSVPVLIRGEIGSGKTTAAVLMHSLGERSSLPLAVFNCSSLTEENFVQIISREKTGNKAIPKANSFDGTLLLKEIADLTAPLQAMLLQYLTGNISVFFQKKYHIICTSSQDLLKLGEKGQFRRDLYYRLSVQILMLPTLRDRLEELPLLIESTLKQIAYETGDKISTIHPDALFLLMQHSWPGNIRELENVIKRAILLSDGGEIRNEHIQIDQFSSPLAVDTPSERIGGIPLSEVEKRAVVDTLILCKGNKARAARMLGISERSIYNKIKRLGVEE